MILKIKKLNENAVIPEMATSGSAGMDLRACIDVDVVINPGERALISTGLAIALESNAYVAYIYARSGLATKRGLAPANKVGVVDCDYRGEVMVLLINLSDKDFVVNDGERIAQMVIAKHEQGDFIEVEVLDETERGEGGYGHTGVK